MNKPYSYNDNAARLRREISRFGSSRKYAAHLGINQGYISRYLDPSKKKEPSDKTDKGKEIRRKLGITKNSPKLSHTRKVQDEIDEYARSKGYKSWANARTIIRSGFDGLRVNPFSPDYPREEIDDEDLVRRMSSILGELEMSGLPPTADRINQIRKSLDLEEGEYLEIDHGKAAAYILGKT